MKSLLTFCLIGVLPLAGCDTQARGNAKPAGQSADRAAENASVQLADKPLAEFQKELLELAMDTATSIPIHPHIADRSKSQQAVVEACLKLDRPARALECADAIKDWRRGACYADLAFYLARHGREADAPRYIDMATSVSETAEDWCRDNIRVKVGMAYAALGKSDKAEEYQKGVDDFQKGMVAGVEAMTGDSFDKLSKQLDAMFVPGNYDVNHNVLQDYVQLYNRFYDDPKARETVKEKVKGHWEKMPIFVRIDLVNAMAGYALDHHDQAEALKLVDEAKGLIDGYKWPLENKIPLIAGEAMLRYRSGDEKSAEAEADAIFADYKTHGTMIVDVFRGEALRPLAEAYMAMNDTNSSLSVYKKAIEEGCINPNSRPRAVDLSATCVSMTLAGVEPDSDLWARMREIRAGLADPW